jgi:hypothetical protein
MAATMPAGRPANLFYGLINKNNLLLFATGLIDDIMIRLTS